MAAALYMTTLGYTSRRPATLPPINRGALMRDAHRVAKQFRAHYGSYRDALAYGLSAAWAQVKATRNIQSLALQVGPAQHTAAQIKASRAATRRCGSSLWGA
jgi:hypothetical protein